MSTTMRDALAYIREHAETFSEAVNEKGEFDVAALESLALRGDALTILERKTTFSEEARGEFLDAVNSLVSDYVAGMNQSVKAHNRFGFDTPSGYKVTLTVEKSE